MLIIHLMKTMRFFRACDIFGAKVYLKGWRALNLGSYWALSIRPQIPEIPGEEWMERTFSGISFRNFSCTSRACPNIPENRPSFSEALIVNMFQTLKAKTCFVGEIIARPDPLPSGLAIKQLASFFRRSKMTLEFVWKIRCYRTFKVLANLV